MKRIKRIRVGLRTLKTAAAVFLAMTLANVVGMTSSRLIFAMLGAIAVMEPSIKESIEACLTQLVGLTSGAIIGVLLILMHVPPLIASGIGIVIVITLYNIFGIRFSPALSCIIVVSLCAGGETQPVLAGVGRIWDTSIGFAVGLLINAFVFPYNNTKKTCAVFRDFDREVIAFLEDMFNGDMILPDTVRLSMNLSTLGAQMKLLYEQLPVLRGKKHRENYETLTQCQQLARQMVGYMQVVCRMERVGILNEENQKTLIAHGANICQEMGPCSLEESDIVMNYMLSHILNMQKQLRNKLTIVE